MNMKSFMFMFAKLILFSKVIRFVRIHFSSHLLLQAWQKSWKVSELLIFSIPLI